ncbi:MAG: ERCC4 domain-containing protein [Armatimonadota bacterium]
MESKLTVVIDTREKEPYSFDPSRIEVIRHALPAGDYSILGFESSISIERKSLEDFVGTLIKNRERFRNELLKLQCYRYACIVVEANIIDLLSGKYRSGTHPHALFGSTISIIADYGIPVYFCANRQASCLFVQELLLRLQRKVRLECHAQNIKATPG